MLLGEEEGDNNACMMPPATPFGTKGSQQGMLAAVGAQQKSNCSSVTIDTTIDDARFGLL